mmetsp:Transcript_79170/g.245759  ORF Transcript_79170/g.245759 Transcript_79170/m.245759 type:complete len:326 (+) Transcript_79170:1189-2166(+)
MRGELARMAAPQAMPGVHSTARQPHRCRLQRAAATGLNPKAMAQGEDVLFARETTGGTLARMPAGALTEERSPSATGIGNEIVTTVSATVSASASVYAIRSALVSVSPLSVHASASAIETSSETGTASVNATASEPARSAAVWVTRARTQDQVVVQLARGPAGANPTCVTGDSARITTALARRAAIASASAVEPALVLPRTIVGAAGTAGRSCHCSFEREVSGRSTTGTGSVAANTTASVTATGAAMVTATATTMATETATVIATGTERATVNATAKGMAATVGHMQRQRSHAVETGASGHRARNATASAGVAAPQELPGALRTG